MRKTGQPQSQNKYDQLTNLTIDLQSQLTKSIILPKISQKTHQKQLKDYLKKRQIHQEAVRHHLQGEVQKLRKQVLMMEDRRYLWERMKTQEQPDNYQNMDSRCKLNVEHCHRREYRKNTEHRNSEDSDRERIQRNSEKRHTRAQWMSPRRRQSNVLQAQLGSQVLLQQPSMTKIKKNKRQSKIVSNSICIEKENMPVDKNQLKKKKHHISSGLARRRWRKSIIAVYFSILLPSLARKIYTNKLKIFMKEYPHQISKYYLTSSKKQHQIPKFKYDQAKLWTILQDKMNFMEMVSKLKLSNCLKDAQEVRQVKVHFQFLLNQELSGNSQKEIKEFLTYEQQLVMPKNVQFLMGNLKDIACQMIDNFKHLLKTHQKFFKSNWQTFAQNLLTNSFINNSRPKLLQRVIQSTTVKAHPQKQTLLVQDQHSQIVLLSFDIFCRIYIYRWMYKLHKDKLTNCYDGKDVTVGGFLLTIFYLIGEMLIDQNSKSVVRTKVKLSEAMVISNLSLANSLAAKKKIRPILPLSVKKKYRGLNIETKRLIIDPPYLDQASTVVLEYEDVVSKIKAKMVEAGYQLHKILKKQMKNHHIQVKEDTINQQYIIREDKERQQNLLAYEQTEPSSPNNGIIQNIRSMHKKATLTVKTDQTERPKIKGKLNKKAI